MTFEEFRDRYLTTEGVELPAWQEDVARWVLENPGRPFVVLMPRMGGSRRLAKQLEEVLRSG